MTATTFPDSAPHPLRILITSYRSHPRSGGQGVYLRQLTRALSARGHQVTVISGPPYPDLDEGVQLEKLPSLDLYRFKRAYLALRPWHLRDWLSLYEWWAHNAGYFPEAYTFGVRFARWIADKADRFDILHDNQTLSTGILAAGKAGLPMTATLHHPITRDLDLALCHEPYLSKRWLLRRWHSFLGMQKRVARAFPHLITISQSSKRDFAEAFALDPARIDVALLGVPHSHFHPQRARKKVAGRIVCTTSADVPLKGLRYLMEAFAKVKAAHPSAELHIVGTLRKGPARERMQELGLQDHVTFHTNVSHDELAVIVAEAEMVVVPSLYEGFGLPAAEAMASGTATIATTGGSLPEVVGEAGLLVPPADPQALSAAMARILTEPDLRARLEQAGRARVEAALTWQRCAAETEAHYYKVLGLHADHPAQRHAA